MIDSLSVMIKNFLIISKLENEVSRDLRFPASTNSSEAFRFGMYAEDAFAKRDWPNAEKWYLKAIDKDSNYTQAIL